MANKKSSNILNQNDFIWLLNTVSKNWYLFVLIIPIAALLGLIYNHKQKEFYNTKIEILLKTNDVYDYQENLQSSLGFYNYYGDISNQKRIIGSYDMMQKVLKKLDLSCSYFIVGRLNTKEFFNELPFKIEVNVLNPNLFEVPIDFKIINENQYELSYALNDNSYSKIHYFDSTQTTNHYSINTRLNTFLDSKRAENFSEIQYQIIFHNDSYWVNNIISNLSIENIEYTSLLVINLLDEVPERSRMILDTLAKEYIGYTLENQFRINENTSNYINIQLENVINVIDSIQFELQNFRDKKGILNVDKESDKYFQTLMSHKSTKRKLGLKVKSLENLITYLTNLKDANISPPSLYVLNDDEYLKNSINDFYETQLKKLEINHGFKTGHQELNKVNEKIINQRKDLLIYIQNTISAMESQINVEIGEIAYYESLVKKIPISERDMASIERKLKVNEKLYDFLLEKRATTSIARSGIVPQTKIIEKARTIGNIGGKSNQNIIIFLAFGFVISLIISVIKRLFFEKIQQVNELADSTIVPVLGGIPYLKNFSKIMDIKIKSKDNFVESLRAIRTSMNFLLTDSNKLKNFKSFLITSIHPGEGKTFTSINMARIFASSGKKVLIVDFDMHKPKVHKELNISNEIGNSTNLSSNNTATHILTAWSIL